MGAALNMSSNSVSSAYYARCAHGAVPPGLPEKSPGRAQLVSAGLSTRLVLHLAPVNLPSVLFTLFCVLACCVRCWLGLGAYETEQEKVDRS